MRSAADIHGRTTHTEAIISSSTGATRYADIDKSMPKPCHSTAGA